MLFRIMRLNDYDHNENYPAGSLAHKRNYGIMD